MTTFNPHIPSLEEIQALALELGIPEPVIAPMLKAAAALSPELPIDRLAQAETAEAAWEQITSVLPHWEQDRGMAQLAAVLAAACLTRQHYSRRGIPDSIFLDTMKCLPRFILETRQFRGEWIFDRGFWTWRQTGELLFRLGALEFEYRTLSPDEPIPDSLHPGDPVLNVHIPSDAKLNREQLDASYAQARAFFSETTEGPWTDKPIQAMLCDSWLLSPALDQLLPETSGIRAFSAGFRRYHVHQEDDSFYQWVYKLPAPVPPEELPENTSLQRSLKAHLLSGGHLGVGFGILTE